MRGPTELGSVLEAVIVLSVDPTTHAHAEHICWHASGGQGNIRVMGCQLEAASWSGWERREAGGSSSPPAALPPCRWPRRWHPAPGSPAQTGQGQPRTADFEGADLKPILVELGMEPSACVPRADAPQIH